MANTPVRRLMAVEWSAALSMLYFRWSDGTHQAYPVTIEQSLTGIGLSMSAYPGLVAVGSTLEETFDLLARAAILHLEGLQDDVGRVVPCQA